MARNTSVSDNGTYPEFCYMASKHDEVFRNFRRHPIYCRIIPDADSGSANLSTKFLETFLLAPHFELTDEKLHNILKMDSVGNPELITYLIDPKSEQKLTCGVQTPRYLKTASDIFYLFDVEKIKTVAEIGIGYGGQCNVLMNLLSVNQYNLIDLPEVLALAERCLNSIGHTDNIRYFDGTHLYHDIPSDFVISDFAFAELNKGVQDIYLEKIILKAKRGYITWNSGIDKKVWDIDSYSLNEILSIIPNSKVVFLPPLMYQDSEKVCTIIWGTK